jgi:hypothetical protein
MIHKGFSIEQYFIACSVLRDSLGRRESIAPMSRGKLGSRLRGNDGGGRGGMMALRPFRDSLEGGNPISPRHSELNWVPAKGAAIGRERRV